MKNILLTINIILLLLVGYLYYLHFHNDNQQNTAHKISSESTSTNDKSRVAYIDLDSLQNNYGYYQKLKNDFEKKQNQ